MGDIRFPVYTRHTDCRDCYKCVRACPVKAIRVDEGTASVVAERCISCGRCVDVCPARAKTVRDDLGRARHLLTEDRPVYVSLAPSWPAAFPGVSAEQMRGALSRLGFAGTGETALGAEEVSAAVAREARNGRRLLLSSACPAAVRYISRYMPHLAGQVSELFSPLLAHCRLLRQRLGPDIRIVFFGPCLAKKHEADSRRDLLDLALTFVDLKRAFAEAGISPETFVPAEPVPPWVVGTGRDGTLYPVEGGMMETLRPRLGDSCHLVTVSGVDNMRRELGELDPETLEKPLVVECLACAGGCVNGPCLGRAETGLTSRLHILAARRGAGTGGQLDGEELAGTAVLPETPEEMPPEKEIQAALRRVGKRGINDELNCGGCGYATCRAFAVALVDGRAEPEMCAAFMRRQAQKKANALIRCMPSAIVVVDQDLQVMEHNVRFREMFVPERVGEEGAPALEGVEDLPFADLLRATLSTGEDVCREHRRHEDRLFNVTAFTITRHQVAGAVIEDVTTPEMRRDQIARRAGEVIEKNLSTVQQVACTLGEHMAETEILLRSIAEDYGTAPPGEMQAYAGDGPASDEAEKEV